MANHILIGIGGTGYNILSEFRKRLWAEVPDPKQRQKLPIRFLYIDSCEETTPDKLMGREELRVSDQDTAITPNEYINIKNVNLNAIFANMASYPHLRYVIGNGEFIKNCLGDVGAAAGQKRRAGRILFASNAHNYVSKLKTIMADLQKNKGDLKDLVFYVFAGLAGGTGSGSIVDAVAQLLTDDVLSQSKVEVYAMIPEQLPPKEAPAGRYHANGYAALTELSALNAGAFLPADVVKGTEHIILKRPTDMKQFGLNVYTNVNRNGVVVDSLEVLPSLVADMVYFRVMSPESKEMARLNSFFKGENVTDFLIEYKTTTRPGKEPERARTKAVGSFGIKRVRYPNEKLISHACDVIARNILMMCSYLNYDNDEGFINEAPRAQKDYSEYIKKSNLKNWKLSEADLSLSVPILPPVDGRPVETFEKYWENVSNDYDFAGAKSMGHPLQVLEQYFDMRYKGETNEDAFREEKGVEAYFVAKGRDQVISDSAAAIVNNIRNNLFTQWQQGVYSAYDVRQITEQILKLLQDKNNDFGSDLVKLEQVVEDCRAEREEMLIYYNSVSIILDPLFGKRKNTFLEYCKVLAKEYTALTKIASINLFQKRLLPKLIQQFVLFQSEIQSFLGRMQEGIKDYGVLIGANSPEMEPDLRANIVEVADIRRLENFENELLLDRAKMEEMAQLFRERVAMGAKASFERATLAMATPHQLDVMARDVLAENIKNHHDVMMGRTPILGLNVMEQLRQMFGNSDKAIGNFASSIVSNSEVFINLNEQEVIEHNMPNNAYPKVTEEARPRTIMLVSVPKINTDDQDQQAFVEALTLKLKQSFKEDGTREFKLTESTRDDEITIVSNQNLFPVRGIDYMPFLRSKYEELTNTGNESTDIKNRVLLHSEGTGEDLPPLFGEGEGVSGDDVIKYIFLGAALGFFKIDEDELGNKGWGMVTVDEFDSETFKLLSTKFTGILSAPDFTPEVISELVEKVDEQIATPRHVNEKARLTQVVKDLMKQYVLPEAGSPNNDLYKRFAAQAKNAMQSLN